MIAVFPARADRDSFLSTNLAGCWARHALVDLICRPGTAAFPRRRAEYSLAWPKSRPTRRRFDQEFHHGVLLSFMLAAREAARLMKSSPSHVFECCKNCASRRLLHSGVRSTLLIHHVAALDHLTSILVLTWTYGDSQHSRALEIFDRLGYRAERPDVVNRGADD